MDIVDGIAHPRNQEPGIPEQTPCGIRFDDEGHSLALLEFSHGYAYVLTASLIDSACS